MKPRLPRSFPKKGHSKRCGTLSQLCVLLLFLLLVFYISVASYLIPGTTNKKYDNAYDLSHPEEFIIASPREPKLDSYKIPISPRKSDDINSFRNKHENKKFIPPKFDSNEIEKYKKSQKEREEIKRNALEPQPLKHPPKSFDGNIPSIKLSKNNYNNIEFIQNEYLNKCPEKYPNKIPEINSLNFICSNLNEFDIRFIHSCETCEECVPPTSKRMKTENEQTSSWQKQFKTTLKERRDSLQPIISHLRPKIDGPIILMVFNYGYSWLFYNFLCSLENNNIDIKNRTIIVTTDLMSKELVEKTGFITHYPMWLGEKILNRITSKAAASFALGGHKWIVSIQIALITDLIHLGYDVIMQDIDIIWYKNPIPYLMNPIFKNIDIQMSVDGTGPMGLRGPGNSGFFIIRSNCKMKLFMDTMISLIGLIMAGRSDQMLWNTLLQEKHFRMIHYELLTTQLFISGFQVNIKHGTKRKQLPANHFIVHASWTTDQWDKIEKFYNIEHWYYTKEQCPIWYDFNMLPDLAERKWHIRDKTQPQEQKFKKLGFFRDSTNGDYEKHS